MNIIEQLVLDESNIIFHPMMGNSYQLNDVAKEILLLIRKNTPKEKIIDTLYLEYGIDKNELFIDVSDFYTKLKIYGLVK